MEINHYVMSQKDSALSAEKIYSPLDFAVFCIYEKLLARGISEEIYKTALQLRGVVFQSSA